MSQFGAGPSDYRQRSRPLASLSKAQASSNVTRLAQVEKHEEELTFDDYDEDGQKTSNIEAGTTWAGRCGAGIRAWASGFPLGALPEVQEFVPPTPASSDDACSIYYSVGSSD